MVQDGKNYGDEFLADLDCMEVAERTKEGYESDVPSDSDNSSGSDETSDSAMDAGQEDDSQDSDYAITFKKKKRCVAVLTLVVVIHDCAPES
jgi:hypothetical protein